MFAFTPTPTDSFTLTYEIKNNLDLDYLCIVSGMEPEDVLARTEELTSGADYVRTSCDEAFYAAFRKRATTVSSRGLSMVALANIETLICSRGDHSPHNWNYRSIDAGFTQRELIMLDRIIDAFTSSRGGEDLRLDHGDLRLLESSRMPVTKNNAYEQPDLRFPGFATGN